MAGFTFSISGHIPAPITVAEQIIREYGPELSPEQVRALAGPDDTSYTRRVMDCYAAQAYEKLTGQPF